MLHATRNRYKLWLFWAFGLLCTLFFTFTPPRIPGIGLLQTNLHPKAQIDRLTPGIAQGGVFKCKI